MRTSGEYHRLPGFSLGPFRRRTLWAASDHVLAVDARPFAERYRRYFYADIQALVLTQTDTPLGAAFYALPALPALAAVALWITGHRGWSVLFLACSILLLVIFALRQECSCYIKTRISAERLPTLRRLRTTRKTLAILKDSIERAQGALPPEIPAPVFETPAIEAPPRLHSGVRLHAILFALMAINAVGHWFLLGRVTPAWTVASGVVYAALLSLAIVTAIRQYKTNVPKPIQTMVYLFFAQFALSMITGILIAGVVAGLMAARHVPYTSTDYVQNHPMMLLVNRVAIGLQLAIGATGLLLIWRRHSAQPPPSMFAAGDRPPPA